MPQVPEFIQILEKQFKEETHSFTAVHRLIDYCEAVIKFHTVVVVSNFMEAKDIPPKGKLILSEGLRTPSLGTWAYFTLHLHGLIPKEKQVWEDFSEYFKTILFPATEKIVTFRNRYAHGAVPSQEICQEDIERIEPILRTILEGGVLDRYSLEFGNVLQEKSETRSVILRKGEYGLNLSPLLIYRLSEKGEKTNKFYFYNDVRNKNRLTLLNYDSSDHIQDGDLRGVFDKAYPIEDWVSEEANEFRVHIDRLTDTFKGRQEELRVLQDFIKNNEKGHFFIWGDPGIGKSSLVARAVRLARFKDNLSEFDFQLDDNILFIEYFMRRSTPTSTLGTYLRYMGESMESKIKTSIPIGKTEQEMGENYRKRLPLVSKGLRKDGKKLVLFLDGLDEGEEALLQYIPTDEWDNILVVLSGRKTEKTSNVLSRIETLRGERKLEALKETEIRALLYDVVNKYALQESYIKAIADRSKGSPLYLHFLMNDLLESRITVNDLNSLPKSLENSYEIILERYKKTQYGGMILVLLLHLSQVQDFQNETTITYFLYPDKKERISKRYEVEGMISVIQEVLMTDPSKRMSKEYQIFHEAFREYLEKKYKTEVLQYREYHLLVGLRAYPELYSEKIDLPTLRYCMTYIITHLLEDEKTIVEAENLVLSKEFLDIQLDVLQFYTIPLRDGGLVLSQIVFELGRKPCTTRPLSEILKPKKSKEEKFRTTTFVQLVNHTGELSHKASTDIGIAWKWIEEGKVAEALERLSPIQDKQRLFDCYILALWLLTLQPDGEANRAGLKLVLEEVEKNIPPAESETVKWYDRYTVRFFAEMSKTLLTREQVVKGVFDRGDDEQKKDVILNWLGYEKIGDEFEHTKFEEEKDFITKYITNFIALARGIESSYYRSSTLSSIGESVAKLGDVDFGKNLFQEAVEVARGIKDSY